MQIMVLFDFLLQRSFKSFSFNFLQSEYQKKQQRNEGKKLENGNLIAI